MLKVSGPETSIHHLGSRTQNVRKAHHSGFYLSEVRQFIKELKVSEGKKKVFEMLKRS